MKALIMIAATFICGVASAHDGHGSEIDQLSFLLHWLYGHGYLLLLMALGLTLTSIRLTPSHTQLARPNKRQTHKDRSPFHNNL